MLPGTGAKSVTDLIQSRICQKLKHWLHMFFYIFSIFIFVRKFHKYQEKKEVRKSIKKCKIIFCSHCCCLDIVVVGNCFVVA